MFGCEMHLIERHLVLAMLPMAVLIAGCGTRSVPGGTKGVLRFDGELLSEIQVVVHQVDGASWRPVGFGVTKNDGSFELVTNGAQGPLWLAPGEYRCTLESAGAPIQIPEPFAQPDATPLKISWSADDQTLDLDASSSSSQ
jgi:hypothetical protein